MLGYDEEKDDLAQHMSCPRSLSGILSACNLEEERIEVDLVMELCLIDSSDLLRGLIADAFQGCHAVELSLQASVQNSVDSDGWQIDVALLSEFASPFWSEHPPALGQNPGNWLGLWLELSLQCNWAIFSRRLRLEVA